MSNESGIKKLEKKSKELNNEFEICSFNLDSALSKGQRLIFKASRIDNKIMVFVNGCKAFDHFYNHNPVLNIREDLTNYLVPGGANSIVVICINHDGPYSFDYNLYLGGRLLSDVCINGSGGGVRSTRGYYIGDIK